MFGIPLPRLGRPSRFTNASFTGVALFTDAYLWRSTTVTLALGSTSSGRDGSFQAAFYYLGQGADGYLGNAVVNLRGDTGVYGFASGSNATAAADSGMTRGGAANSVKFGNGSTATTASRTEVNKAVTAFTDTVAKTVFTVTVPNAAHHAVLEVEVQGALGAGGAIGAGEAMATNTYKIAIVRTAGVATVATASAATHAVAVAVAGAATVTATAAVSAIAGANSTTQTFTIDVTITKSGGASNNHTCLAYAKLVNANATGITIA